MNKVLIFLASALLAGTAFAGHKAASASAGSKQPTARQMKMMNCGKLAKGKEGDAHEAFMKDCMAKKDGDKPAASSAPAQPQAKM